MPTQFKGTQVAITEISIVGRGSVGSVLRLTAVFMDKDGVVHATTTHEIALTPESGSIYLTSKALLDAVKRWVEHAHYRDAESQPKLTAKGLRGIAETLQGGPDPLGEDSEDG